LKSSLQVHTVDGETVRTRRLGDRRLELITSDRKMDLQLDVHKKVNDARFTSETEHDDKGNVTCRLPNNSRMSFEKFIMKIVDLFVGCIKRYKARMATKPAPRPTTSRPPRTKRRSNRYRKRHHMPSPALTTS